MNEISIRTIDEYNNALNFVDAEAIQLDKGIFNSKLKYVNLKNLCIILNLTTQKTHQIMGSNSKDYYSFHIYTKENNVILNNITPIINTLFIGPPRKEFELFSKDISSSYTIQIEKNLLEDELGILDYQVLDIKNDNYFKNFIIKINYIFKLDNITDDMADDFIHNIIRTIKYILHEPSFSIVQRKVKLFTRITDYMKNNYQDNLTIEEIAFF